MTPVRIGCVKYLNTLPLIEGLKTWKDCELVAAVPSRLISMLRAGEVDVALASVIDAASTSPERSEGGLSETGPLTSFAARQAPGVVLLPVGMIGCDGPTLTVRLFSRVPLEKVARVAVDTDSHTSVVLMQVLMHRKFGVRVEVVDFDAREHVVVGGARSGEVAEWQSGKVNESEWPETVLLIGDKVVTDAPPESAYPYQMDLGAAWKELTGLPFVYAVWMCRAGEEESLKVRAAAKMLERARLHNATRMDWVVASHAEERGWPRDLAAKYVGTYLKYGIGEPEREAVEKFLRWAGEMGLVRGGGGGEVVWAGEEEEKCKVRSASGK